MKEAAISIFIAHAMSIMGLVNNYKTCPNIWTRHGIEDFLDRQKAETFSLHGLALRSP